jgi:hypothetical protein
MITADDITGTWRMIGRDTDPDGRAEMLARYSEHSDGLVIFSPDGWMSAIVCHGERDPLPGDPAWQSEAPAEARIAAFDSYVSYAGRWRIEDGKLKTTVHYALNPNWVGGDQVRDIELRDDGTLRLTVTRTWPNGKTVAVRIDWRRAG